MGQAPKRSWALEKPKPNLNRTPQINLFEPPRPLNNSPRAFWDHSGKNPKNPPGPDPTRPKSPIFSAHLWHPCWISALPIDRKCDLAPDGPVFTRFGAMAGQISRKTTFLTGPWHACARLYQSPTPKHMGCLLDKNRRRQPWLQTRHLLCPQPRKLQHLTSQYHQQHRGGAEGAPAVSSIPLRCQMLQLSWLRTQQMSWLQASRGRRPSVGGRRPT